MNAAFPYKIRDALHSRTALHHKAEDSFTSVTRAVLLADLDRDHSCMYHKGVQKPSVVCPAGVSMCGCERTDGAGHVPRHRSHQYICLGGIFKPASSQLDFLNPPSPCHFRTSNAADPRFEVFQGVFLGEYIKYVTQRKHPHAYYSKFWLQRLHLFHGAPRTHENRPYNQMSLLKYILSLEIPTSDSSNVPTTRDGCEPKSISSLLPITAPGAIVLFQGCAVYERVACWSDKPVEALSALRPMQLDLARSVYSQLGDLGDLASR